MAYEYRAGDAYTIKPFQYPAGIGLYGSLSLPSGFSMTGQVESVDAIP
jgi:hypothetical protein